MTIDPTDPETLEQISARLTITLARRGLAASPEMVTEALTEAVRSLLVADPMSYLEALVEPPAPARLLH